nr:lipoprotein [Advenella sp. FME57]
MASARARNSDSVIIWFCKKFKGCAVSAPSIKRLVAIIVTLLVGSVGLTACGYKAPLYLPTAEQKQKLQERDERIKARKAKAEAEKRAKQQAAKDAAGQPASGTNSTATP